MTFRVATWNINSVRLRIKLVEKLLKAHAPDVLCLQETKCPNDLFPIKEMKKCGYPHVALHGQKGHHGVAIVSRWPILAEGRSVFAGKDDRRHVRVTVAPDSAEPMHIHSLYVPSGGDTPDPETNEKFAHKLKFLDHLARHFTKGEEGRERHVLTGDLNVAPLEHDVWSHKQMLDVVSHTPIEVEHLDRVKESLGWIDHTRVRHPEPEKVYSWWSYRAKDWQSSDRGRRLDHIWTTPDLSRSVTSIEIVRAARGWRQPSDHVPVIADFDFSATG